MKGLTETAGLVTTALLLLLLMPRNGDASCLTCTSEQQCVSGDMGTECLMYWSAFEGRLRCQFSLDCDEEGGVAALLDVSPAGTYLASSLTSTSVREGEERSCQGYLVARADDAGDEPFPEVLSI
jgi:hypothetical protein